MNQYLLSTYGAPADEAVEEPPTPPSPETMQAMMQRIVALEAEMDESGTFLFGGHLHGPDAATVVDGTVMTDGPYVESKEHIAGFYIINADDLDAALAWADKVAAATNHPIEVRPFFATGRVADQMHGMPGA